ncbi:MAG: hypothetical protein KDA84_29835, partial [Planctomycetaceae bacterium]|nr:hypothetical protein [Planctomycetaceae bacterium]
MSYTRSLLLGSLVAAVALSVTVGLSWKGLRAQSDEEALSNSASWETLDPPGFAEERSNLNDAGESRVEHLTPIATSGPVGSVRVRQTQGQAPFAPPPADANAPSEGSPSLETMPESPPDLPVGNNYEDPLPETEQGVGVQDETTEQDSIVIDADFAQQWKDERDHIAVLRGRCRVMQGRTTLFGQKMVIWQRADASQSVKRERLIIYVEGDVLLDRPG